MAERVDIPRLVVAGASSGSGKTTVAVALLRALRARGLRVAPFKCGPDYLDPTYHARAAGRQSHNLDGWMMGRDAVLATFARSARGADVAVIEGVMGLYDGASPAGEEGSTAELAKWLAAPVVAVVDAAGMGRTAAALARGLADFDPDLRLAGVICNRVGSRGHLRLLREALSSPPLLGGLPSRAHGGRHRAAGGDPRCLGGGRRRVARPRRHPRPGALGAAALRAGRAGPRTRSSRALPDRPRLRRGVPLLL
jgi:cobyrinic acid a,c-diamide synthase